MKKLPAIIAGAAIVTSAFALPARAVTLSNDYSSSWNAYGFTSSGCKGTRKTVHAGSSTTGVKSVTVYTDTSWYLKWSSGATTSRNRSGYCINLPSSARVFA